MLTHLAFAISTPLMPTTSLLMNTPAIKMRMTRSNRMYSDSFFPNIAPPGRDLLYQIRHFRQKEALSFSRSPVGAIYDRALFLESTNTRGHRPRLQLASNNAGYRTLSRHCRIG